MRVTQLELAREGTLSPQMRAVAEKEGIDPETVREMVAEGSVVIPANINHK
ncbi:MAG: phosphomethylpyrimidine synthase ThiC, partial [Dehalococcoidia bacterium]